MADKNAKYRALNKMVDGPDKDVEIEYGEAEVEPMDKDSLKWREKMNDMKSPSPRPTPSRKLSGNELMGNSTVEMDEVRDFDDSGDHATKNKRLKKKFNMIRAILKEEEDD